MIVYLWQKFQELNVGQLSAATLWQMYKTDLQIALEGKFLKH